MKAVVADFAEVSDAEATGQTPSGVLPAALLPELHNDEVTSAFDRKAQYHMKRRALLYEAARLFNEGGERGAGSAGKFSLTEVARNLNVTKTALYYYFKNKQEILYECYALSFDVADRALELATRNGGTAAEQLEVFLYHYALSGFRELYPTMGLRETPLLPAYSKRVLERRDSLHRRLRELMQKGMEEGSIAPCNPVFAVTALIGAIGELLKIFNPRGEAKAEDVAGEAARLLAGGFKRVQPSGHA